MSIDARLDGISCTLDRIGARLDGIGTKLDGVADNVAELKAHMRAFHEEVIDQLELMQEGTPMAPGAVRVVPYDLSRFLSAQEHIYEQALAELREGRKRSHWMWFIFPQLAGLGVSAMARRFAIPNADEARAYLRHPVLGPRLIRAAQAVVDLGGDEAREVFGTPDDLKLRSSATLFAHVSPEQSVFHRILDQYFSGRPDTRTLELLRDLNR